MVARSLCVVLAVVAAAAALQTMTLDAKALFKADMRAYLLAKQRDSPAQHPPRVVTDADGRSPFMRRHNVTVSSNADIVSMVGKQGSTAALEGFFVMPCRYNGKSAEGKDVSSFDTRVYNSDLATYELDRTYYVNDDTCTPANSDIYFKLNIQGKITYHGVNKGSSKVCTEDLSCARAEMEWTHTNLFLSNTSYGQHLADALNLRCGCSGVSFKVNTWFNISASQCKIPPNPNEDFSICANLAGAHDYFNYEWTDPFHYITSRDDYEEAEGYNNPVIQSYVRERIPESNVRDPDDCDYILFAECEDGISEAMANCKSCVGLECDGCLFRELNPNWDPESNTNVWHQCCPCIYAAAERYQEPWLQTHC